MENKIFLSIVVPAYNESNRIVESLDKIISYFKSKNINYEIIVVNDGSKDQTIEVVKNFSKKHKKIRLISYAKNRGKGYATKNGVLSSKGSYVLFTDADLSTPIWELKNLMKWLKNGYDFVFGSRGVKNKVKVAQPFYRRVFAFLAKVYVHYVIFTFATPPKDTQCGFKLFTRSAAQLLFRKQKVNGGIFDTEIIYLAGKFGLKTKEVPVVWVNNPDSKINFIKCVMFDPIDLIKVRIWDLLGKYD